MLRAVKIKLLQKDRERKDAHSASNHYAVSMIAEVYNLKSDTGSTYKVKKKMHHFHFCTLMYKTKYLAL
jgi:hypothetical protein